MSTLLLLSLIATTSPAAPQKAPLEGALALREEVRALIRFEEDQCVRSALTSSVLRRENHESEDQIFAEESRRIDACTDLTKKRLARLETRALPAGIAADPGAILAELDRE